MADSTVSVKHYQNGCVASDSLPLPKALPKSDSAASWLVMPGITDLAVHSRDLETEAAAARASGITRFCLQPDSLNQVADRASLVAESQSETPEILALGATTRSLQGTQLSDLASLKNGGCIAASDAGTLWRDSCTLKRALEYAQSVGLRLHLHPNNAVLSEEGCAHAGSMSTRLGLNGIPSAAETSALCTLLELIEDTNSELHIARISCARSVALIADAKARGLPVTADVAIHNLVLNESAIDGFNALCHTLPPLRTEADRQALLQGVEDGILDAIVSDHRPCSSDDKLKPFPATKAGAMSLSVLLPLTLSLVAAKELSLESALRALTEGPAAVLNRQPKGTLWVDTTSSFTVGEKHSLGSGDNSPYRGWTLPGDVHIISE